MSLGSTSPERALNARACAHPRPAASDSIFISIIVKAPVVQLIAMFLGFFIIAFDYPAPFFKGSAIHRSFPVRIVLLLLQTFFSILFYQVRPPRVRVRLRRVDLPLPSYVRALGREQTGPYTPSSPRCVTYARS